MRAGVLAALTAVFLGACVSLPEGERPDAPATTIVDGPFPPPDAGAARLESLHFLVRTYGSDQARQISELAEASYNRVMIDTNLFSFRPRELYQITVYADADEYLRKTSQPSWSGGVAAGNAIYTYAGPNLARTIAHEMTHLVFYEYMGRGSVEQRWVNEGLAVYQEEKAASGGQGVVDLFAAVRPRLQMQSIPMDQMAHLVPASERQFEVSLWYAQAESLVRFMIERGGRLGFSQFLSGLREGRSFDESIAAGFPSNWRTVAELKRSWELSLQ